MISFAKFYDFICAPSLLFNRARDTPIFMCMREAMYLALIKVRLSVYVCITEASLDRIASTSSVEEVGVVKGNRARWN